MTPPRVAVVHDWLDTWGGGENVLAEILLMYPDADLYTLVDFFSDDRRRRIGGRIARTSFLQHVPGARNHFRKLLPLFPRAIEAFDLRGYDLILSSSHAVAKGVRTTLTQLHVCYCYTPMRYVWDLREEYLGPHGLSTGLRGMVARRVLDHLRDWDRASPRKGWGKKPVTWVSIEDARAYAEWACKRLPHEWEWQYAAQGDDGRLYPWGNDWNVANMPAQSTARTMPVPADVDAHPQGASPFGVMDLVGNVWQWTDEFHDAHTRAAALRGGSAYLPQTSHWYFPQAYQLDQHGKYLLMAPSRDRSAGIGFRCVVDAA